LGQQQSSTGWRREADAEKVLGREDRHTIFEAELLGLSLAAEMLKDEGQVGSVMIGVDSQRHL